jgi:hypothetical protein
MYLSCTVKKLIPDVNVEKPKIKRILAMLVAIITIQLYGPIKT